MKLLCFSMSSAIKGMVSKNKLRYKDGGFNLDLSYISQNIIAMGYPADTIEGLYRNHIDDVVRFFDEKHKDQYMIYNLCAESKRKYNTSKFHGTVVEEYSFQDHNPPPFVILKPFCESLHKWLTSNSKHVAAIHCKAGKGRTGVMICAYLVHVGGCQKSGHYYSIDNADQALDYYGRTRTRDSKGVTIPSQKRYVYYYEDLVKRNLEYRTVRLRFSSLILTSLPNYTVGAYTIICEIYQIPKKKIKTFEIEVKKGAKRLVFNFPEKLYLEGDVKFELFIKKIKNEKLFQFCINTFFVAYGSDTYTVSTTLCPNCNGEKAVLSTKKFSKPICTKFPNYFNDQSVIDISFLDQLREEKLFQDCDCIEPDEVMTNLTAQPTPPAPKPPQAPPPASEESINNKAATTNNRSDSSPMLVFCQPQHSPPLPSLNMSTSASSSSSSSSTQSLCRKASNSDCAFKSTKSKAKDLYLVLPKEKLDKAYKDTANKIFPDDFKVVLKFSITDSHPYESENTNNVNCCYDNYSTDTYSEDEEDAFEIENSAHANHADHQESRHFTVDRCILEDIRGETTYL